MASPAPALNTRRSAAVVGVAVIASRLFGLVREQVFAAMFGAGKFLDAYNAAFQIPNLFRDLFAEGALSTAFTTVFARTLEEDGEASAWQLANLVLSTMVFFIGVLCCVGILAAPLVVQATNFGFHNVPGKFELTVHLTQILFPFILFVSVAAAVMGMLNARFVFGVPASASTVFNIVSVVSGVGAAFLLDPGARRDWLHPHFTQQALYGVCFGVLLGGLAQLGVQLPSLWRLGFRFRWRLSLRDERLRQVWALMWPSMIAGAAVQVNVLINGMFASEIDGARSWLGCAFRLMQFPIGVFGVSLATVTLPGIARRAARDDVGAFGRTVSQSLRLALFFTVPAAVGLAVLARSIITLIYQHGHFTAQATLQTAHALQAYAVGLAAYAALKVLVPCFYALGVPKLPLRVSLIGIGLNLVLNLLNARVFGFGHVGLALITSCVAMINFGQLLFALSRRVPLGSLGRWVGFVLRLLAAAAVSGAAAWVGDTIVHTALRGMAANLALPAVIAVAAGGFFVAARLLAISEATDAWALIMRRLRPKRATAS